MNSMMSGFDPRKLSPIMGQLCVVKIPKKRRSYIIGIGKILHGERGFFTLQYEHAVHLVKARFWHRKKDRRTGMRVKEAIGSYGMKFIPKSVDLEPEDWQKIVTDKGEALLLSFHEKEIEMIDTFLNFHMK